MNLFNLNIYVALHKFVKCIEQNFQSSESYCHKRVLESVILGPISYFSDIENLVLFKKAMCVEQFQI